MTVFFKDAEYRQRIQHPEDISVSESSLESLHRAQVFTLPFELDRVDKQDGQEYRLKAVEPWGNMLQLKVKDEWMNLYSFDLEHVCHSDIETGNHYTSTSPDVHFTQIRIASLVNPAGRSSLSGQTLTCVKDGETTQTELPEGSVYIDELKETFGIELHAGYEDFTV